MYRIKPLLCCASLGVALALALAIVPSTASPTLPQYFSVGQFTSGRSPLVPLKKGETELLLVPLKNGETKAVLAADLNGETKPLLAPLFKGGWGDQTVPSVAQVSKLKDAKPKPSNPPPPPKNPGSSAPGGRRDRSACPQDTEAATTGPILTALIPATKPGLTLAERPTFLVYVPKTSAKTAEFSLRNQNGSGLYRTTLTLTNTPDIVSISLPSNAPALEIKKRYMWSFAVICNPSDRVEDQFVTATVQRTELDPTRLRQIEQAPLKQRVSLYQKADIWYDALPILLELRRTQPNDPSISAAWREFLQSGGVDAMIVDTPLPKGERILHSS